MEITEVPPGAYSSLSKPQTLEYQETETITVYVYTYTMIVIFIRIFRLLVQAVFHCTQQGSAETPELQVTACLTARKLGGKNNLCGALASTDRSQYPSALVPAAGRELAAALLRKDAQQVNVLPSPWSTGGQPLSYTGTSGGCSAFSQADWAGRS